ncbi:hypothetical protein [Nonomuraea sp. NPDC050643]|uniref:hypothetical protein n=1 Tax=Nonomuraea sp. NPDC050643 TaxID=3155660 RepID=UPI0033D6D5B3
MSETIAIVLPTAALTAALYGLWLNSTRSTILAAIEVHYKNGGDYQKVIKAGRLVGYPNLLIPVAVVIILTPLASQVVCGLSPAKQYSPVNALFLLVFFLWIAAGVVAVTDIIRLENNARTVHALEVLDK